MNFSHPSSLGRYFPFLDGIRGLAVTSVVLFHTMYFNSIHPFQHALLSLTQVGWLGVPIFFVLSGYLISLGIISAPKPFDYYSYIVRRISKIVPPFLLSILVFSILSFYRYGSNHLGLAIFYNSTTLAHFCEGWNYLDPVYWSLFIEIHFYIALPIIYFLLRKFFANADLLTCAFFFIVPALFRLFTKLPSATNPDHWNFIYNLFPRALDYFGWGILFSIISIRFADSERIKKFAPTLGLLGICLLVATYFLCAALQFRYSIQSVPCLLFNETFRYLPSLATFLILFLSFAPGYIWTRLLSLPPLVYIGVVSYEWFLFHMPPAVFVQQTIPPAHGSAWIYFLRTGLPTIGTFVVAALIYHFLSAPILEAARAHLKKRKLGRRFSVKASP